MELFLPLQHFNSSEILSQFWRLENDKQRIILYFNYYYIILPLSLLFFDFCMLCDCD